METTIFSNILPGKQQLNWYAVHTLSRAEKAVAAKLDALNICNYLPLMRTMRQWSDRKKWVNLPLFNSYLFVKIKQRDYFKVLEVPGVAYIVKFDNKPVVVPEEEINLIRILSENPDQLIISDQSFEIGDHVEILRGPFSGIRGLLVETLSSRRVAIKLTSVNSFALLSIPLNNLKNLERHKISL